MKTLTKRESLEPWTIYALSDPRSKTVIRYIGKTSKPLSERLRKHRAKNNSPNYPISIWNQSLRKDGLLPIIFKIEETTYEKSFEREEHWIKFFRPLGLLLNQSDGHGVSGMGFKHSEATLEKQSKLRLGKPMSAIQKSNWIASGGRDKFFKSKLKGVESECGRLRFNSMSEAAEFVGVTHSCIFVAASKGGRCCGIKWKYSSEPIPENHKNDSSILKPKGFQGSISTEEEIQKAINMRRNGFSQSEIAVALSLTQGAISRMLKKHYECS